MRDGMGEVNDPGPSRGSDVAQAPSTQLARNPPTPGRGNRRKPLDPAIPVDSPGGVWLANRAFPRGKSRIGPAKRPRSRWVQDRLAPRASTCRLHSKHRAATGSSSEEGSQHAESHVATSHPWFPQAHGDRQRSQGDLRASRAGSQAPRRRHAEQVAAGWARAPWPCRPQRRRHTVVCVAAIVCSRAATSSASSAVADADAGRISESRSCVERTACGGSVWRSRAAAATRRREPGCGVCCASRFARCGLPGRGSIWS